MYELMRLIGLKRYKKGTGMEKRSFVLKCGGSTLAELPNAFFHELNELADAGWVPVIVHGGGPAITRTLERLGVESRFVDGLRVTDEAVLDVVEMVLAGTINKQIVRRIQQTGAKAIGLSGSDGLLLEARRVDDVRMGHVGEIVSVNVEIVRELTRLGYVPVIAPVGADRPGQRYNINADTAAGAVASHLGVRQMIVVTDVPGIIRSQDGVKTVLPHITTTEIEALIDSGEIYGGMVPKVRAAVQCMQGNVQEVVIVSGTELGVLTEVLNGKPGGTRIIKGLER
jgi:acetylglutamate kinase